MNSSLILVFTFLVFAASSQTLKEADVPATVKEKFASLYPQAKAAKWEKENEMYEAELADNKTETSVLFDAEGNYLQKEVEISTNLLPQRVKDYVAKNLAKKRIDEAAMITNAAGVVTYEAEVGNTDYLFDAKGNLVTSKPKDEDRDGED